MTWFDAFLLGIVEGLTEFLPISSTGHLILTSHFLGHANSPLGHVFEVFIQIGAILAVCLYFHKKIFQLAHGCLTLNKQALHIFANICIATLPALIFGLLFNNWFKIHFFNAFNVSIALIVGGFLILWIEHRYKKQQLNQPNRIVTESNLNSTAQNSLTSLASISKLTALKIGLCQCVALMPGISRSGSTIMGGLLFGLPRVIATEFSFFLAIPINTGAGILEIAKAKHLLQPQDLTLLIFSSLVAFLSALACIHFLLRYVASHDFKGFAYYRIVFGLALLWILS